MPRITGRRPPLFPGILNDRTTGHGGAISLKSLPFFLAFPRMIPAGISPAPVVPHIHAVSFQVQGHADIQPLLVIQFSRLYMI